MAASNSIRLAASPSNDRRATRYKKREVDSMTTLTIAAVGSPPYARGLMTFTWEQAHLPAMVSPCARAMWLA